MDKNKIKFLTIFYFFIFLLTLPTSFLYQKEGSPLSPFLRNSSYFPSLSFFITISLQSSISHNFPLSQHPPHVSHHFPSAFLTISIFLIPLTTSPQSSFLHSFPLHSRKIFPLLIIFLFILIISLSHNFKVNFTYYLLGIKMVIQNMQSYLEGAEEGFIHRHHSSCIVKLSTVIWCREQSDQLSLGEEFITIFNNLWGSDDSLDIAQYFVNIIILVYHSILYVGFFLTWSIWKTH